MCHLFAHRMKDERDCARVVSPQMRVLGPGRGRCASGSFAVLKLENPLLGC
jgi:hypothetical protein